MYLLFISSVAILTAILPYLVRLVGSFFPDLKLYKTQDWLPPLAAVLFVFAFFIPDVHISRETITFQQHFMGGVYASLLYLYFKKLLGWEMPLLISLLALPTSLPNSLLQS